MFDAVKDIIDGFKILLKNPKEALMKIGGSIFKLVFIISYVKQDEINIHRQMITKFSVILN